MAKYATRPLLCPPRGGGVNQESEAGLGGSATRSPRLYYQAVVHMTAAEP